VDIVGEVDDLTAHIRRAHFVIMPSDEPEPFGLVAVEAFANARPVIASAGGGLGSIVSHETNGFLFPNRDVDVLRNALLSATVKRARQMSPAAYAAYKERYSVEAFATAILKVWRQH
jgi:glycosyltransferase involved in cell wall biosynthesis